MFTVGRVSKVDRKLRGRMGNMNEYDSREDTQAHINRVAKLLFHFCKNLEARGRLHDATKLVSPEKETFDEMTPRLKDSTYGSDEYKGFLEKMKPALDHHYVNNRHHPEHHKNGVNDMDLFDVVEMLCDWKAASERHATGDINKSLEINAKRFNMSDELVGVLRNTIPALKW